MNPKVESWNNKFKTKIELFALVFSIFSSVTNVFADPEDIQNGLYINSEGPPIYELINSAKTSIDIEIYQMDDNTVLSDINDAIKRNVRVRIIKDGTPVGKACRVFEPISDSDSANCSNQKEFVNTVRASNGGAYVPFNKDVLCGKGDTKCFEHGKMVLVDSKKVMISTGNFDPSNLCDTKEKPSECNRDYSIVTDDQDVIETLTQVFEHDLKGEEYDVASLLTPDTDNKLTISPYSEEPIVTFIRSAKNSIRIENQYLKEKKMNEALIAAAHNGVDVQVTTASFCAFGHPSATVITNETKRFTEFDNAGIRSKMFTKNNRINGHLGYMHAKAIIIDDKRAWVGSVNGSDTSFNDNREFGLFIDEPSWIEKLKTVLDKDFESPASETWQQSLACAENN